MCKGEVLSITMQKVRIVPSYILQYKEIWHRNCVVGGGGNNMLNINAPAWQWEAGGLKEEAKVGDAQMEREEWKSADETFASFSTYPTTTKCFSSLGYSIWLVTDTPPRLQAACSDLFLHSSKLPIHSFHFSLVLVESLGWVGKWCRSLLTYLTLGSINKLDLT